MARVPEAPRGAPDERHYLSAEAAAAHREALARVTSARNQLSRMVGGYWHMDPERLHWLALLLLDAEHWAREAGRR